MHPHGDVIIEGHYIDIPRAAEAAQSDKCAGKPQRSRCERTTRQEPGDAPQVRVEITCPLGSVTVQRPLIA